MQRAIVDCLACRNKGEIVVRQGSAAVRSKTFEHLGRSTASGYLYLLCKYCRTVLLVDPAGLIGTGQEAVIGIVLWGGFYLRERGNDLSDTEKAC
jgi:hypothetical protein